MKTINLEGYRPILCDNDKAREILTIIRTELDRGEIVKLDFSGIISMATCCSSLIFGTLYQSLGKDKFFNKILFTNTSESLQKTIRAGIKGVVK